MSTVIVCPLHHHFRPDHLERVTEQMRTLGPPRLRGHVDSSGFIFLREGTHRIRAAHALGLVPIVVNEPWWRSRPSLMRARWAARLRGLRFDTVAVTITSRAQASGIAEYSPT